MNSFSERNGHKKLSDVMQTDSVNDELRNGIWNALDIEIWNAEGFMYSQFEQSEIYPFSGAMWRDLLKLPVDERPGLISADERKLMASIRKIFFAFPWYEVYDFIEFIVRIYGKRKKELVSRLNHVLEHEGSAYRIIEGQVAKVTDDLERAELELALADTRFGSVTAHLAQALKLMSDRNKPDYRNSIKESISAVEGMARIVCDDSKATLSEALKSLERKGSLHPALRDGFLKIYGYTSDADGIRHALMAKETLIGADAKFFLLACTSFVNYLKSSLA